jgi:putative transposase
LADQLSLTNTVRPMTSYTTCWDTILRAYASVPDARAGIGRYLSFYNAKRPHSSLDRQTPDQAYFNALQPIPVAA